MGRRKGERRGGGSAPDAVAFAVPGRLAIRRIAVAAAEKLAVSTPAPQPVHVRYLDTFDRRLQRAGLVLEHRTLPGATGLRCREFGRARILAEAQGEPLPAFPRDISHMRLRALLAPLVGVRRLLVVAETCGRLAVARGRDREDKTVVLMECFSAPRGPRRLTVHPLRGYERFAARAVRRLRQMEGIAPDDGEPMLAASAGPDARYGGADVSERTGLDPAERSDVACKRLLARLDAALETNAPGIEADLDPECLHEFRVAVRKARSLLREMKRVFPSRVTRRLRADLSWLGQCTGALRDLDVHLLELTPVAVIGVGDGADDGADDGDDATVRDALRLHLDASRKREYRALCRILRSARFRRVRSAYRGFLDTDPPVRPRSENALTPIASLSAIRIRKVYRRILTEGRRIRDDSPSEAVHDLRKSCKRLRYLLEFFRELHPAKPVEGTIARLKRLQDNLGAYQDVQVQRAVLEEFRASVAASSLDATGIDAVDRQCAALTERERRTRAEFSTRFARYDSKRAHKAFEAALGRSVR